MHSIIYYIAIDCSPLLMLHFLQKLLIVHTVGEFLDAIYTIEIQMYFVLSDSDVPEIRFSGRFFGNDHQSRFLYTIYRKFRWFDNLFIGQV